MKKTCISTLLIMILALVACNQPQVQKQNEPVSSETRLDYFDTVINVTLYQQAPETLLSQVFAAMQDIHNRMSVYEPESEISRLNRDGILPGASADTFALIETGYAVSSASGGAFDVTIGPLVALWDVGGLNPRAPELQEIEAAKTRVGYHGLGFEPQSRTLVFQQQGMAVDLGAIAKGYACNEAARILKEAGLSHAILDFGGNIFALGDRPDGSPWRVGIRTPLIGEEAGYLGVLRVKDRAVVTSGIYERFFEMGGEIYHHIIDPHTGYPVRNGLLSVTIVCESSTMADALSTACFVLGPEEGLKLLSSFEGVEGLLVTEDKSIVMTPGLYDSFELRDERFRIEKMP